MTRKTVSNSNPGTSDIVGGNDWDFLIADLAMGAFGADYHIIKSGSTYYVLNSALETIDSSTTLTTPLNSLLTTIGTSKKTIQFGNGDFSFTTTVSITSSHDYLTIKGRGFGTRFLAATDIPCLYLDGCRYVTVNNLAFANDSLTTKASAFVDLGDATTFNTFNHIQMMQNNTAGGTDIQKGIGFRFICDGGGLCYFNTFEDIIYRNLDYCNVVDTTGSTTASVWVNGNHWINNRAFYFLSFLKVSQKGGGPGSEGLFDANSFNGIDLQCNPTGAEQTTTVFDFEGVAGQGYVTCRMVDIISWDKNAAGFALKVTPRTTLFIEACQNIDTSITGTGAGTGGAKINPTIAITPTERKGGMYGYNNALGNSYASWQGGIQSQNTGTGAFSVTAVVGTATCARFSTGNTINSLAGLRSNGSTTNGMERDQNPWTYWKIGLNTITSARMFIGYSSATAAAASSADPLANLFGVGFWFDTGVHATNIAIMQNNNAASSNIATIPNVGTMVTGTAFTYELRAVETSSKFQYRFNGYPAGSWTDINTAIPAATTKLGFYWYCETLASTAPKTFDIYEIHHRQDA